MILLILGVALWSLAHLFPVATAGTRRRLLTRVGEPAYKGSFSLVVVASLVMMVLGWRATTPVPVYAPPSWGVHATQLALFVAVGLFVVSALPTNAKRVLRHPQLSGLAVWSGGHLLANGDQRSLILFGGLGLWALLSIFLINRRDGDWRKPDPRPRSADVRVALVAVGAYLALYFAHPLFAGVTLPMP